MSHAELNATGPDTEALRLQALRDLLVLDTAPEPLFDDLARMASDICQVPVALLSLVDAERQWFKANLGLPGPNETPRDIAFCAHAIEGDTLFEVPDASADPRFAHNPLVTGAPQIRFYAGAPLVLPDGARVGTLCVIDRTPRKLDAAQALQLQQLARLATQALLMRRDLVTRSLAVRTRYEQALAESETRYRALVEDQDELVSLARPDGSLVFVNAAYAQHFGTTPARMVGSNLYDYIDPADRESVRQRMAAVLSEGEAVKSENRMLAADGRELWVAWTNRVQRHGQGAPLLHSVGRDITGQRQAEQALRASQAFLARTGRVAGVGGWELDLQTQALRWSEETRRIHGVGPDYVPTVESAIAFYAPEARAQIEAAVQRGMQEAEGWDLELPFCTADGRAIWVRAAGEVEFENGQPRRLLGAFQDITERHELQRLLQRQTGTLRAVLDALPAVVSVMEPDGRYRFVNTAFEQWVGQPRSAVLGCSTEAVVGAAMAAHSAPWVQRVQAGETVSFEIDDPLRTDAAGRPRHLLVSLVPLHAPEGGIDGYLSMAQDVTRQRQEAVRLLQLAQRDPLTGLLNRRGLFEHFSSLLAQGDLPGLALLCVDLDHFKPVNDQYGHAVGDQVLQAVAQRLQRLVRPSDAVARVGGDEFVLLLAGVRQIAHAGAVADKIVQAVAAPVPLGAVTLRVGASVGLALGAVPGVPAETAWAELQARADSRLYEAKAAGRGRVVGAEDGDEGAGLAPGPGVSDL